MTRHLSHSTSQLSSVSVSSPQASHAPTMCRLSGCGVIPGGSASRRVAMARFASSSSGVYIRANSQKQARNRAGNMLDRQ